MWNTFILGPMVNILIWIYNLVFHNFGLAIILVYHCDPPGHFTPLTASQLKARRRCRS